MNATIIKAIGYVRVSTEEQAREGVSIEAQEERIRALATAKGWNLLEIVKDPGYSGKNLSRPGIMSLIDSCRRGTVDVVIVQKVDRLTRKQRDLWYLLEDIFYKNQVGFLSVVESFDSTTAAGTAFLGMIGVFAQLERDLVAERTREALNHKRAKGEWVGRTPTGFRINEDGRLEADPEALRMIARAKRLHREGASYGNISRALGMSKTTIYKLVNAHMTNLKANYCKSLGGAVVR